MADVRPPLTEADLRETRDGLLKDVQDQRRAIGVPVPDAKTAEQFIDPILRRVEVEHDRDRTKDLVRPAPAPRTDPNWAGEPGHSPKIADVPGTKATLIHEDLGAVTWRPDGTTTPDAMLKKTLARERKRYTKKQLAVKRWFRHLLKLPGWKDRIVKVFCANIPAQEREKQMRAILADSIRAFDPFRPAAQKIIVGGR